MKLRTEKNLKIISILFLVVPQILIVSSFVVNCDDDGTCEQPIQFLGAEFAKNIVSITGAYLAIGMLGILISSSLIISGDFSSNSMPIIGIIPWLVGIFINTIAREFSKWKMLYIWIIITQISYMTYWIHPFPISPF